MEYLFIILILVSLIVYVFFLFNSQIVNRKCLLKKKTIIEKYNKNNKNNYGYFTESNMDINTLLNKINSDLSQKFTIENPLRNYTYSKNNLEDTIKNSGKCIIGKALNKINSKFRTRYKLLNIETINRKIDIINNEEITIIFLIHEVNKFSTIKLVINYFKDSKNYIKLNYIKSLHNLKVKSNKKFTLQEYARDNVIEYRNINGMNKKEESYTKTILDNDMDFLNKIGAVQEPCKYDLDIWDTNSVNVQLKLNKKCTGINHSDRILPKQPYVNPTIFKL